MHCCSWGAGEDLEVSAQVKTMYGSPPLRLWRNSVHPGERLPLASVVPERGDMDELAIAAPAVTITIDANADDGLAQRGPCGIDGAEVARMAVELRA